MVDKKQLMSGLDRVGQVIDAARTSKTRLTAAQVHEAKRTLGSAAAELFRLKAANAASVAQLQAKRAALTKSAGEKLISEADAKNGHREVQGARFKLHQAAKGIQAAIDQTKVLAAEVNKLAAAPELEKLDKGHTTDESIKAPTKAPVKSTIDPEALRKRLALRRKATENMQTVHDEGTVPTDRPPTKGLTTGMPPKYPDAGTTVKRERGAPVTSPEQAPGMNLGEPAVSASKKRAKHLYLRAMSLTKQAAAESNKIKQAKTLRQAQMLERLADRIIAKGNAPVPSKPEEDYFKKKELERRKQKGQGDTSTTSSRVASRFIRRAAVASTSVYSATDRVLLADGSIGTVSSVNGENLMVSVAGVEKPVLANTVKRISVKSAADVSVKADEKNVTIKIPTEKVEEAVEKVDAAEKTEKPTPKADKPEAPKMDKPEDKAVGASVADRVRAAVSMVRGGKKVAAEPAPAVADKPEAAPAKDNGTVGKSFTMSYSPAANGKFNVNISETEIVECDTEDEAKALVARGSKVTATTHNPDAPTDASTTKTPDSAANISQTLKGLDQSSKDYGTTSKDEKADPQFSMLKKATTNNPDSPTDASTTKAPAASVDITKTLKGLDQAGKGYSSTSKEEVADPQFSMVKKSQLKEKILVESNRKLADRLSITEAQILADRAVKVGAITEEQRSEQQTVLAELYRNSQAEFKAFSRLIATLETKQAAAPSMANRVVNKVQASIARRQSEIVDASAPVGVAASLDSGTFFEDL